MKGHATLVITGADESTNVSVFSVGRKTAVNQALFRDGVDYDGFADIACIAISSTNGRFGGGRAANASCSGTKGLVGLYAPGVQFTGPVFLGNIRASADADPVLLLGSSGDARITGSDLRQPNARPVRISGVTQLHFCYGTTSHGELLPAQQNRARLEQEGVDVTSQIAGAPGQ